MDESTNIYLRLRNCQALHSLPITSIFGQIFSLLPPGKIQNFNIYVKLSFCMADIHTYTQNLNEERRTMSYLNVGRCTWVPYTQVLLSVEYIFVRYFECFLYIYIYISLLGNQACFAGIISFWHFRKSHENSKQSLSSRISNIYLWIHWVNIIVDGNTIFCGIIYFFIFLGWCKNEIRLPNSGRFILQSDMFFLLLMMFLCVPSSRVRSYSTFLRFNLRMSYLGFTVSNSGNMILNI